MTADKASPAATYLHPPFTIHHYALLGSTNDHLKAMQEAPEFTCITADEQTAGRGRRERSWHSAPGEGLYLSILLRPEIEATKFPLLSLMAAVAVVEAIQSLQLSDSRLDIKWPNDVLINERKVCGVLIESSNIANELPRVIMGIGVNLNHQAFPPELADIATSLALEYGQNFAVSAVRNALLDRLAFWYEELRHRREHKILNRWQQLSSFARGKAVIIQFDHEELAGETIGLNATGALQLKTDTGQIRTVLAGEIKHLRKNN